ncbi:uncharacterized protein KD926_001594 [Aspergillus affinis]|uniref:uncharacterized protein n=1 Tax=Aspergillus affinis TaxID=1070780 RepID=UPI0022FDBE2E|nr:uncharacterized protein KD926_001594 [Aspergillus affinis]KAI9036641.1 hypothetical protein KD926_001594 [Aspergillus affinis]
MKIDIRFICTLLIVLAIAAAMSPAAAADADADKLEKKDSSSPLAVVHWEEPRLLILNADLLDWVYGDPLDRLDESLEEDFDAWDEMP